MMENNADIVELYSAVFEREKHRSNVHQGQIINGIREIGEAYLPDPYWENKSKPSSSYYENASHRCAYLHKYAMVHTGLLCEVLSQALQVHTVKKVMSTNHLKLCSLGAGPGTDIVACLLVLKDYFETKQTSATLIDCCGGWERVFELIVSELRNFEHVRDMVSEENFDYQYDVADLLHFGGETLLRKISEADIITMVKFVSAAACKDTTDMVKGVFRAMKPGALLLFVDNASGGFLETMSQTAKKNNLESVFGPLRHYHYSDEQFRQERYGRESQYETRVSVEIWKKEGIANVQYILTKYSDQNLNLTEENFPPMDTVDGFRISEGGYDQDGHDRYELQCARITPEYVPETRKHRCCTIM